MVPFIGIFIVGLVVGSLLIYMFIAYPLYLKLEDLKDKYTTLENSYRELNSQYINLNHSYHELQSGYKSLNTRYRELQVNCTLLRNNYEKLQAEYDNLSKQYTSLSLAHSNLQRKYTSLKDEYQNLQSRYNTLQLNYNTLRNYYLTLSHDVESLSGYLMSISFIPWAFKRALNINEVLKVKKAVLKADISSSDIWSSIEKIYKWIVNNIKYVHDVNIPYLELTYVNVDKDKYVCRINVKSYQNYIQTPAETIELRQGDCDDQAILAYAMIKFYERYIYGKEYLLYIAYIRFNDGSAHLAVFLPVQGGKLTIIDPAGKYLTSYLFHISARETDIELKHYSNWWRALGGISYIKLYHIDIDTGNYRSVVEGDIKSVASFLKTL